MCLLWKLTHLVVTVAELQNSNRNEDDSQEYFINIIFLLITLIFYSAFLLPQRSFIGTSSCLSLQGFHSGLQDAFRASPQALAATEHLSALACMLRRQLVHITPETLAVVWTTGAMETWLPDERQKSPSNTAKRAADQQGSPACEVHRRAPVLRYTQDQETRQTPQ